MRPSLYLRYTLWESRGSFARLAFFVACLAVGVAAVVAVASLSDSLEGGVRSEAKQLLAADLAVEGRRPLPPDLDQALLGLPGARRTDVQEMVTIVAAGRQSPQNESSTVTEPPGEADALAVAVRSQLVELKAVGDGYPFYGRLELDPPLTLDELLEEETTVVAPELLSRLGLARGDLLRIGGGEFRIAGTVKTEPDRITGAFSLGPRVFIHTAGLTRAGLVERGSRVSYRALIKLPEPSGVEELNRAVEHLKSALPDADYYRVESYTQAQPRLRRGLSRLESYLGLVALLSLLVGGVGVAQAIRAWLASRMDAIAVLKCLGLRPRQVLAIYLGQAVVLGVAGSAVGALLGVAVQLLLPGFLGDLLPARLLNPWQPWALLRGLSLGVGIALVFSLPPLSAVLQVPPSRVLRRDAEPLPRSRWIPLGVAASLVGGIGALAVFQSSSWKLGAQFTGGVLATTGALALGAWLLTRGVARLPRELGRVWMRHGLAALGRPGAATAGAIVALGLGLLVILTTVVVERHLTEELLAELPENAPSGFLIDIQPHQWAEIEELLQAEGVTGIQSVPVVMARLSGINNRTIQDLRAESKDGGRRWALTREQRLTYMEELPPDNTILEGALWSDPQRAEVSLEEEFAEELGVGVGSTLSFDVQGVPVELAVTSVRSVTWESFGINFYLVVEPGVLDDAPQLRLAAARLPKGKEQRIQDLLAQSFPNVTLLRIQEVLARLAALLAKLGWSVRFLGAFTVAAAVAILAGAIAAGSARRGQEVALLKTLGMTRRGVMATFATEYALIGGVAGLVGALGGGIVAWLVVTQGMEMSWEFRSTAFLVALMGGVAISVLAGILTSSGALRRRPVEVLRHE